MPNKSRLEEREDLLLQIGMLVAPIRVLLNESDPVSKVPYVRSQFMRDLGKLNSTVATYCTVDGLQFGVELDRIHGSLKHFTNCLTPENVAGPNTRSLFELLLQEAVKAVRAVPCESPSTVLPGESPFESYCRVRGICSTATKRIEIFDPYLGADVFHTYLRGIPDNVFTRIVTSADIMMPSKVSGERRRDEIVAVSKLLAAERKIRYAFHVTGQQHDRHLRIDDEILHLGGSVKDAGRFDPYTISTLIPTQSNHAFLDQVISGADEWFGPNNSKHRET